MMTLNDDVDGNGAASAAAAAVVFRNDFARKGRRNVVGAKEHDVHAIAHQFPFFHVVAPNEIK